MSRELLAKRIISALSADGCIRWERGILRDDLEGIVLDEIERFDTEGVEGSTRSELIAEIDKQRSGQ